LKPVVKRRAADGSLVDASESEILTLQAQSQLAVTANNLLNLSPNERTAWAADLKDKANELFRAGHFAAAAEKYLEVF
jgi:hypothetical protein